MGKHELRPASPLNLSIYVGGGRETHKDSFSNGECIRTGSVWKSGHLVLNCEIEIYYQLRCSNKPLEKSIDKGDNPVCHLQLSVHGVSSKSHVPWDWSRKCVVFLAISISVSMRSRTRVGIWWP